MVLTPSYHVFDLYKVHQDAYFVPSTLNCEDYTYEGSSVPALNMSTSIDSDGKMHLSICNVHAIKTERLSCLIKGYTADAVTGKIITADQLNSYNDFDQPNQVGIQEFKDAHLQGNTLTIDVPPHSVLSLELTGHLDLVEQPVKLNNPAKGLHYQLYSGNWFNIPDYQDLQPAESGFVDNIQFPANCPNSNFLMVYDGFIKIEKNGLYNFVLGSDDGAKLYLNDHLVINNDGRHGTIEREGMMYLGAGYYPFRLEYFQAGGGQVLELNQMIKIEDRRQKVKLATGGFWHEK